MGNNNNHSSSPQEYFNNQAPSSNYPTGRKEDGWRDGNCTRCGKTSFMCSCTGSFKETAWSNGKCMRCGKTSFMCDCPDSFPNINTNYGPGPYPPSFAQQIPQPMEYSGRKEDGWRDGKCTRCEKTSFMCSCTGSFKETAWSNGKCMKCGKPTSMCDCSGSSPNINPNYGPGSYPPPFAQQVPQPMESSGRKEDGWRDGKCTRCGKSSFMCSCTGSFQETAWSNGKCMKCGKTTFMCDCSGSSPNINPNYGPGPSPPPFAQQVCDIPQPKEYAGRKEDGWRDGKCTRCGQVSFICSCTGNSNEFYWKNGSCGKCGKPTVMCMCSQNSGQPSFNQQNKYIPAQQIRTNYVGRKEDGWRDGKCLRCGKSSFMCSCTGSQKEASWENGNCRSCGRSSFMCQCSG